MSKKVMLKTLAIGSLVAMVFLAGCKKGDTGPAGTAGTNGNANVKSTNLTATWVWNGTSFWTAATWANVSILTSDVNNTGAVMLYEMFGTSSWREVPYTRVINANLHEYVWFDHSANTVTLYASYSDNSNPGLTGGTYKLVCISASGLKPNVNHHNYEEVKAAYNLQD